MGPVRSTIVAMNTVHFMPWCPLEKEYAVSEICLIPFDRSAPNERFNQAELRHIQLILSSYRDLNGRPNRLMTLVKHRGRPVFAEMTDDDFQIARELVGLFCFSALSTRTYLSFGEYCNASNFIFYGQRFALDSQDSSYAAITSRRRDGRRSDLRSFNNTVFSIPVQASRNDPVTIDEQFLESLTTIREAGESQDWSRWQNAIECFNLANTDAENVSFQVEWTLLCSAFERLLDADSKAADVANKFSDIFRPDKSLLAASSAHRKSARWKESNNSLSHEWMHEFYRVRGDFAHGKLRTGQPLAWRVEEHLVLATIAFPLVVKCYLARAGLFSLTRNDQAEINAFECLADSPFLTDPPESKGSMDSWWVRCVQEAKREERVHRAVEYWEKHFKNEA
jgi:hypothetical protein